MLLEKSHLNNKNFSHFDPVLICQFSKSLLAIRSSPDPAKIGFSLDPVLIRANLCHLDNCHREQCVLHIILKLSNSVWYIGDVTSRCCTYERSRSTAVETLCPMILLPNTVQAKWVATLLFLPC